MAKKKSRKRTGKKRSTTKRRVAKRTTGHRMVVAGFCTKVGSSKQVCSKTLGKALKRIRAAAKMGKKPQLTLRFRKAA